MNTTDESDTKITRDIAAATASMPNKEAWAAVEQALRRRLPPAEVKRLKPVAWAARRQLQRGVPIDSVVVDMPSPTPDRQEAVPDLSQPPPLLPELLPNADELIASAESDAAELALQLLPQPAPPPSRPARVESGRPPVSEMYWHQLRDELLSCGELPYPWRGLVRELQRRTPNAGEVDRLRHLAAFMRGERPDLPVAVGMADGAAWGMRPVFGVGF